MNERDRRLPWYVRRRVAARYAAIEVLRRVRPWRGEGLTLKRCCDRLNAAGIKTFSGREWTVGRLHQIIGTGRRQAERAWVHDPSDDELLDLACHTKGDLTHGTTRCD